jgi:hypothetical protein
VAPARPAGPPIRTGPANVDWRTIDARDTPQHSGLIVDLIAKKLDGMTVQHVFSEESVERALAAIEREEEGWHPQAFGAMLGMPLNQLGANGRDRTPFLDDTDRVLPLYREIFGYDPFERLVEVLQPMAGDYVLDAPSEDGRRYNPGNIRRYEPGKGGLRAHAGNEFIDLVRDGAMSHLVTTTHVVDHMSYFIVLQPPEEGGTLSVYDLLLDEYRYEDQNLWAGERDDSAFDSMSSIKLSPGPGDLIMFGGGWRWHRVDPILGSIPRITWGGFASPSLDGRQIHFFA